MISTEGCFAYVDSSNLKGTWKSHALYLMELFLSFSRKPWREAVTLSILVRADECGWAGWQEMGGEHLLKEIVYPCEWNPPTHKRQEEKMGIPVLLFTCWCWYGGRGWEHLWFSSDSTNVTTLPDNLLLNGWAAWTFSGAVISSSHTTKAALLIIPIGKEELGCCEWWWSPFPPWWQWKEQCPCLYFSNPEGTS